MDAGTVYGLETLVDYSSGCVVSKTLLTKPTGTLTVFAFEASQGLSEHSTPYSAIIQVIAGRAQITIDKTVHDVGPGQMVLLPANITIDKTVHDVGPGQMVLLPANVPHSVHAAERFKMLLTMLR
ncbi:Cupin 2, conserved barrel domain protein [Pelomyxa schiedti]|nr:Cupin 2, conserved barrel domain protein [Pelomyxa schiedti]